MDEPVWDGITRVETLTAAGAASRHALADRAKEYDWVAVLAALTEQPQLVNSTRPGGQARYTVLHQAAHGDAPRDVVEQLLARGAWRTSRDARGDRPVDIARQLGHDALLPVLEPLLVHDVPLDTLQEMQRHFHAVIRERAEKLVREHALRRPELEPLLELPTPRLWFAVPGMYGGFAFWLERVGGSPVLIVESWNRVVEGSGQRHLISPHGQLLLEEGFV